MRVLPVNTDHLTYQLLGDHLIVRRRDGRDGISWDELQAVKNESVGPEACCVEVYPRSDEVVDETNARHLWVVDPETTPSLRWRR